MTVKSLPVSSATRAAPPQSGVGTSSVQIGRSPQPAASSRVTVTVQLDDRLDPPPVAPSVGVGGETGVNPMAPRSSGLSLRTVAFGAEAPKNLSWGAVIRRHGDEIVKMYGHDGHLSGEAIQEALLGGGYSAEVGALLTALRDRVGEVEELSNDEYFDENDGITAQDLHRLTTEPELAKKLAGDFAAFADALPSEIQAAEVARQSRQQLGEIHSEMIALGAHSAADVAGIFDPTPISDGIAGIMSLGQGDLAGFGLSMASMVPYLGDGVAKPAKAARVAKRVAELADKAKSATKLLDGAQQRIRALSSIKKSRILVREAKAAGRSAQASLDRLVDQLMVGNLNPGIGSKSLGSGISYARSRDGARVFFRQSQDGAIEILGKATKKNQATVIKEVLRQFGGA